MDNSWCWDTSQRPTKKLACHKCLRLSLSLTTPTMCSCLCSYAALFCNHLTIRSGTCGWDVTLCTHTLPSPAHLHTPTHTPFLQIGKESDRALLHRPVTMNDPSFTTIQKPWFHTNIIGSAARWESEVWHLTDHLCTSHKCWMITSYDWSKVESALSLVTRELMTVYTTHLT